MNKMTAPDDPVWSYYVPVSVTAPLLIEAGDLTLDATGWWDAESGKLENVVVNGETLMPDQVRAMLTLVCADDVTAWAEPLGWFRLSELCREAGEAAHSREVARNISARGM